MKIQGKHVLSTDVQTLWPMLQDEKVLARISPGVSRIEKIEEDHYKAISDISIGPVRGSFEGEIILSGKKEAEEMTMTLQQKSKIGNAEANITMYLKPEDSGNTLVTYDGSAKVSGTLATMGQRILGGVVSSLSKQVFSELEKIISERNTTTREISDVANSPAATLETTTEKKKSFFQLLIEKILKIWR